MRRIRLFSLLLFAATTAASANDPQFDPERFKAHVSFLADDLMEGRQAGTRGHELAARYIATQLALAGIDPGAVDGSYFQTVNLLETAETGPTPTVALTTARGTEVWKQTEKTVVSGAVDGGSASVKGPLVFAGFGMKDATLGLDD